MKKINNKKQKAASYCCESSNVISIKKLEKRVNRRQKAASYCCESSNVVDIKSMEQIVCDKISQ